MLSLLEIVFDASMPLLLIAMGMWMNAKMSAKVMRRTNYLFYNVLVPCIVFFMTLSIDTSYISSFGLAAITSLACGLFFMLSVMCVCGMHAKRITSMMQFTVRGQGLFVLTFFHQEAFIQAISLYMLISAIWASIVSVILVHSISRKHKIRFMSNVANQVVKVLTQPTISATIVGILYRFADLPSHWFAANFMPLVYATTPLLFVLIGVQIRSSYQDISNSAFPMAPVGRHEEIKLLSIGTIMKMLVQPLLFGYVYHVLGYDMMLGVLIGALPVSPASYSFIKYHMLESQLIAKGVGITYFLFIVFWFPILLLKIH